MSREAAVRVNALAVILFSLSIALSSPSVAQQLEAHQAKGTIKIVDLFQSSVSVMLNYAEGLVTLDKDNNWVPCLARNWRWTIVRSSSNLDVV